MELIGNSFEVVASAEWPEETVDTYFTKKRKFIAALDNELQKF